LKLEHPSYEVVQYGNLNYQSFENGQQMLQFAEHNRLRGLAETGYDQIAEFIGADHLGGAEELHDVEQWNPKSKTTNMSSLLK